MTDFSPFLPILGVLVLAVFIAYRHGKLAGIVSALQKDVSTAKTPSFLSGITKLFRKAAPAATATATAAPASAPVVAPTPVALPHPEAPAPAPQPALSPTTVSPAVNPEIASAISEIESKLAALKQKL